MRRKTQPTKAEINAHQGVLKARQQRDLVWRVVHSHLIQKHDIHVRFPSNRLKYSALNYAYIASKYNSTLGAVLDVAIRIADNLYRRPGYRGNTHDLPCAPSQFFGPKLVDATEESFRMRFSGASQRQFKVSFPAGKLTVDQYKSWVKNNRIKLTKQVEVQRVPRRRIHAR